MNAVRRMTAAVIAALALVGLTACGDSGDKERPPTSIERGKECFDAGGEWDWNEWSGYHCEFGGDDDE
jgi:hypothetical protein